MVDMIYKTLQSVFHHQCIRRPNTQNRFIVRFLRLHQNTCFGVWTWRDSCDYTKTMVYRPTKKNIRRIENRGAHNLLQKIGKNTRPVPMKSSRRDEFIGTGLVFFRFFWRKLWAPRFSIRLMFFSWRVVFGYFLVWFAEFESHKNFSHRCRTFMWFGDFSNHTSKSIRKKA